ncbi:MAG: hypothetical protein WBP79_05250 [Candidatus Acidiferrales bacterium]
MKRILFLAALILVSYSFASKVSFAQTADSSSRAFAAVPAKAAPGAPLVIRSIKIDGQHDFVKSVTVRNVSEKTIVRYTLGWNVVSAIADGDDGFKSGGDSYVTDSGRTVQTELKPDFTEESPSQGVLPGDLEQLLNEKGAAENVFILVGVTSVKFQDGSTWLADPKTFTDVYRRPANLLAQSVRPNIVGSCPGSPVCKRQNSFSCGNDGVNCASTSCN